MARPTHCLVTDHRHLDRAGRLQLPRAHVEALELRNRVRLTLEDDHVGIWPDSQDRKDREDPR